jgi:type IV pilus assembly protein PilW
MISHRTFSSAQRGVTLVEIMVSLVIGLVISLAAAAMYLAVSENSRSMKSNADINETGKLALDTIGREIQKAGFYPAQYPDPTQFSKHGSFYNAKTSATTLFDVGLIGCDGAAYNAAAQACGSVVANAPDTLIINYFSTPEFGATSLYGNANDCNRSPVSADTANAAAVAAARPLYVSNRFGLTAPATYIDVNKNSVTTRSLGCHGNGNEAAAPQPMFNGVSEMVVRYGLYAGSANESPTQFLTAMQVSAKPTVDERGAWQRVSAVKVCLVIHSLENSRQEDKAGSEKTYVNCQGVETTPPAGNRYLYKRFERVFAVRNNMTNVTVLPP